MEIGYIFLASERSERDIPRCAAIKISVYLFIHMVRTTSFSAWATNQVLVKRFHF